ncbi:phage holin [Bacillus sp. CLL-7-23]|uniref:Phage holin n=1 Tax=Bacillus changyiensis TaxID=3004103 RepID=A0ABT4WYU7_9BACI|nr:MULTISPECIES: phage holin [Bacillus]MDA7025062.1 phage holin [Bacillus changyiensis]NPC90974.1 phage holin [Bacillus sp. WMMC1349]NPC91026.1 phage holin [Bacillus sp. WMMC1349]NPC91072.1 phage holin [Bacillus sp. WMMC1349]NPC94783.1 phage holin [Bacillus sp. WMMC1349]
MKNFDKGTVVRTVLLFIALINQTLMMFGKGALPISEDQVNTLADTLYLVGSTVFTIITSIVAWYKNNYVTEKGKKQKEVLKQNGLTK